MDGTGVGTRIKQVLKSQGKTIAWLAEESGVSKNSLYTITKRDDTNVKYENLEKIASALEVSPWYLMGGEQTVSTSVLYLCDRRACEVCSGDCKHTTNIRHAKNFELIGDVFWEKETPPPK